MHACVSYMCVPWAYCAPRSQNKALDPQDLGSGSKLPDMGDGHQAWVLCKSSKCSNHWAIVPAFHRLVTPRATQGSFSF